MSRYSITDARAALPELIKAAQHGDEVAITRHGEVVAVLIAPGRLRPRRAVDALDDAARLHAMLTAPPAPEAVVTVERAEELIAAIRHDRDGS